MLRNAIHFPGALAGIVLAGLFACTPSVQADVFTDGDRVMLHAGPYVYHRDRGADHNDFPLLVGVEWESAAKWALGASYFENSFNQPCVYMYVGKRWFLRPDAEGFYIKLTGGPLYGYKDEYENKVPFNHNGLAWAIIPGVGYQYQRAHAQLVILGTAGLMLTFGYDFWK